MANRYTVALGAWNDTAVWSATSGGAGGASIPTSTDDVFVETNSPFLATAGNASCRDLTITWSSGWDITISGGINIYGSFSSNQGPGFVGVAVYDATFKATTTGKTITGASALLATGANAAVTFNGVGGGWTLQDAMDYSTLGISGVRHLQLLAGHLNTNGKAVKCGMFTATGSAVKELTLGASTIEVQLTSNYTGPAWWDFTGTNLTVNAGTSLINFISDKAYSVFKGGGKTYYNVKFESTGLLNDSHDAVHITGENTFNNLEIDPPAAWNKQVYNVGLAANQTINGTLTLTGNSINQRIVFYSYVSGARTITAAATSLSYVTFMDITAAGAASPFTGTSLQDIGGNTNITFSSVTRYWVGNGGNFNDTAHWSATSGGASGASVPLAQDTVIFDASSFSSGSQTITYQMRALGKDVSFAAVDSTPTFNMASSGVNTDPKVIVYGNLQLSPLLIIAGETINFFGRTAQTLTSNGATDVEASIAVYRDRQHDYYDTTGGIVTSDLYAGGASPVSLTLQDNLALSPDYDVFIGGGIFDANDFNVTLGYFDISTSDADLATLNMGSGTWTITADGGVFSVSESVANDVTINAETSHLKFVFPSGGGRTQDFNHSVLHDITYYNVSIIGSGNDGDIFTVFLENDPGYTVADLTFNNLIISGAEIVTKWTEGRQYTFNNFVAHGSSGNLITVRTIIIDEDDTNDFVTFYANNAVVSYVKPINNHAAGPDIPFDDSLGGVDGGGNVNWFFGGSAELSLQTTFLVGSDLAGDIQQLNAGKDDDSTPIYYELETQELEFNNRALLKTIYDKLGITSQHADDSKIEIIPDNLDAIPINIDMGKRVNTVTLPQLKGHYITLRWSGNSTTKSPILEGFYLNKIKDDGYG